MNKNGWGQAKEGKVSGGTTRTSPDAYKPAPLKSSKDLNGLKSKYQGKKG